MKNGNTYRIARKEALDITEHLPGGNYTVGKDEMTGQFFLEHIDNFNIPSKIYGDCLKHTDRIIRTFLARDNATGVMLTGEKGSGKTLLTKNVCAELAKQDVPTIVINAPWCGDKFNSFIQSIEQPCAILFDEFEKVYDSEQQEMILTLLDGVFPSKKLFMLTTNDKWRVDRHMRNRPGRIFYMLDFKGLDVDFIREYCEDNLKDTTQIDKLITITMLFDQFNFDMLKAVVEEMNRYGDTPQEAMKMLNAKPEFGGDVKYNVQLTYKGMPITRNIQKHWNGNPMIAERIRFDFDPKPKVATTKTEDDDLLAVAEDDDWITIYFTSSDIVQILPQEGSYTFATTDAHLVLTRVKEKSFHWDAF